MTNNVTLGELKDSYPLNILMYRYETWYFPRSKKTFFRVTRRPVCMVAAILTLLAVLLLFSGLCFCPVLLWYLWRRLSEGLRTARRDFGYCLLAGLCLAAVDTWVVAPFLAAALAF